MALQLVLEIDGIHYDSAEEMRTEVLAFLRTVVDTERVVAAGRYQGFNELRIGHVELHVTKESRRLPHAMSFNQALDRELESVRKSFNPDDNTTGE